MIALRKAYMLDWSPVDMLDHITDVSGYCPQISRCDTPIFSCLLLCTFNSSTKTASGISSDENPSMTRVFFTISPRAPTISRAVTESAFGTLGKSHREIIALSSELWPLSSLSFCHCRPLVLAQRVLGTLVRASSRYSSQSFW